MSETDIKKAILDALHSAGAFAFRVQSGIIRKGSRFIHLSPPGTPDILVIVPPTGQLLGLEVKTAIGEERESQIRWSAVARRLGCRVEMVRTPQDAVSAYQAARLAADSKTPPRAA